MAPAKVSTLTQVAKKLKLTSERVRQLVKTVQKASGKKFGVLAGNTIVLTDEEVEMLKEYRKEEVRKYFKGQKSHAS